MTRIGDEQETRVMAGITSGMGHSQLLLQRRTYSYLMSFDFDLR